MPYVTPPTFTDPSVLSAANLNVLSADIAWLYGLSAGVNVPAPARSLLIQGTANTWTFRHKADWLNVYLTWVIDAGYVDHLAFTLTAGATTLYTADPWPVAATGAQYFAYSTAALVIGTWYTLTATFTSHTAGHVLVAGIRGATAVTSSQFFESDTDYS